VTQGRGSGAPGAGAAENSDGSLVRLEALHKWFGDLHVLKGIDLGMKQGEVQVIIGPSGSGKSTLLRCVNLLEVPTQGRVWFEGRDICDIRTDLNEIRTHIGIVLQAFNLFPHRTVLSNITLALEKVLGLGDDEARERAVQQLGHVGLAHKVDSYPGQLSGGQQQRVAVARALAFHPRLLLMDEPLGALDRALRVEMQEELRRIHRESETTVVYVTHDQEDALTLSDRVAILWDGRLQQIGAPRDLYRAPANRLVATFFG